MGKKFFLFLPFALLSLSPTPLVAQSQNPPKKVFQIPLEITSYYFVEKPKEKVPKKFPVKPSVRLSAGKVGLIYPKEIFVPHEKVKRERGFFSCGKPSDKELYSTAVELFNKGELKGAKEKFVSLLYRFPSSPFTLKAKYYLGVIAFKEGDYEKAYKIFKNLCQGEFPFSWKKFACYNAVISGLYIGKRDYKAASSHPFWKHFLLWLDGKEDDYSFYKKLNCKTLEVPYKHYCEYLTAFINPSKPLSGLPSSYLQSLKVRELLLSLLSGRPVDPQRIQRYIKDPKWGTELEYFYTYYLINWGYYKEALEYIKDLYRKDRKKALELAKLLVIQRPEMALQVLNTVSEPQVWKVYLRQLYNRSNYGAVLRYAPNILLYRLAGYSAYLLGDYEKTALYLGRLENRNETDERILLDALLRLKRWKEFTAELKKVKDKYPDLYREFLGWYYYYRGNWAKAAPLLKDTLYRAIAYFNLGAYQKVLALLGDNSGPTAKVLKAKALLALGNFDGAIAQLRGLSTPEALYLKGIALFAKGNYRQAAYWFEKLLHWTNKYPDALLRLADCYYNLREYEKAKRLYIKFIRLFPKDKNISDAYLGLINLYLTTGDLSLVEYIYRIVERYPNLVSEEIKLKLAQAFAKNGQTQKALKLLNNLLRSKDPYIRGEALLTLAKLNPQRAEDYLKEVISLGVPQLQSRAVINLAYYYLQKGEREKAKQLLDKFADRVTQVDKLIELYILLGDFKKLYYLLQELIAVDNSYTKVAFDVAGKYRQWEFYKLALYSLDPKIAATSAYRLELLALKRNDLRSALKYALTLKVRKLKYEPIYSRAIFVIVEKLYEKGYISDACQLIGEINEMYLNPSQKLKLETIKVDCKK
ncbi:MAG TPA: tetratricopeptide repeat protein [Aquifex aeolicus]|nr:tetratricopeptide repeat protein [Aquifex aeolicus]